MHDIVAVKIATNVPVGKEKDSAVFASQWKKKREAKF
jgi:hypothetical protein